MINLLAAATDHASVAPADPAGTMTLAAFLITLFVLVGVGFLVMMIRK